jgi:hypothetical protein
MCKTKKMAAKKATFSVVVPVLNGSCSVPTTVPLPLSPTISLRKIKAEDLATITEHDDEAASYLKGGKYTITLDNFEEDFSEKDLNSNISSILFSLNVIASGAPLSVDKAYILRSSRANTIKQTCQIHGNNHSNRGSFKIEKGVDLEYGAKVYESALVSLAKHPAFRITMSRFNSAMGRGAPDDKIIDLCIALESVFQAQTEISFQFALYNAILSENDGEKRLNIFKLLKKLYSQRSTIVHGNGELDLNWMNENWSDLVRIAKASILKKMEFLVDNDHGGWKANLESLALGVEHG